MEQQQDYITEETREGLEMFWQDKPKELPSVLSGFTPAPDVLIKKYSFVTALVWGRIWRYCQGADGVCRAKLETIAGEIGMSIRTVIRHAETLCADGYLRDTTPNRRNKPHVYADTYKIRIRISVEATMTESHSAVTESHSAVTESHSEGDRESHEESIKKALKKKSIKNGAPALPKATDIPELVLYRSVVAHWPKQAQRPLVISAIEKISARLGRTPTADDLTPFWLAWSKVSGNEWSLTWLDWAVSGRVNGSAPAAIPQAPAPVYTAADLAAAEAIRAMRGGQ